MIVARYSLCLCVFVVAFSFLVFLAGLQTSSPLTPIRTDDSTSWKHVCFCDPLPTHSPICSDCRVIGTHGSGTEQTKRRGSENTVDSLDGTKLCSNQSSTSQWFKTEIKRIKRLFAMAKPEKKWQPGRQDILINTDWGIPHTRLSPEQAESQGLELFQGRWVTRTDRIILTRQIQTYRLIRVVALAVIFLGAVVYLAFRMAPAPDFYGYGSGLIFLFAGLLLWFFHPQGRFLGQFILLLATCAAASLLALKLGQADIRSFTDLPYSITTTITVLGLFAIPVLSLRRVLCVFGDKEADPEKMRNIWLKAREIRDAPKEIEHVHEWHEGDEQQVSPGLGIDSAREKAREIGRLLLKTYSSKKEAVYILSCLRKLIPAVDHTKNQGKGLDARFL
jgi:hypothetical protein